MAMYRLRQHGERDIHIRARTASIDGGGFMGSPTVRFEGEDGEAAFFKVHPNFSVVPEHMLFAPLADNLVVKGGDRDPTEGFDFLRDALFSHADKVPFSPDERRILAAALNDAKNVIQREFSTSPEQQQEISQKIDYLVRKVSDLSKFDWKRLFVASLVGISVDLCFGTSIPIALAGLFRQVLVSLAERLPSKRLQT